MNLTENEIVILKLIAVGKTKREISTELNKSIHTVDSHIRSIYRKLDVHSKAAAVNNAIRNNII